MKKLSLNTHIITVLLLTLSVLGGCNYTVDDFWKNLKSGEIETPLSQNTGSIAKEFSPEPLAKHRAKYQITKALSIRQLCRSPMLVQLQVESL